MEQEKDFEEYVTFSVTTKDGTEVEMAVMDEFEFEKVNYVVGAVIEGDQIREDGMFIYKASVKDEELQVEKITDPEEYEKVADAYTNM